MSFTNFERCVVELIIFLKFYLYGKLKDNIRLFLSDICQRNRCQESIFARGNKNTTREAIVSQENRITICLLQAAMETIQLKSGQDRKHKSCIGLIH